MIQRLHIAVRGAVQGVGFRPFVYRLASEFALRGWVFNSPQGVFIEVEGEKAALDRFLLRLEKDKPARSSIQSLEFSFLDPIGLGSFAIRESASCGHRSALVLPDIATCGDCLADIFNPENRRYRYPFTNCTNCGPRFSIIEALPYDRANTSMGTFKMCADCRREYEDPTDRRFHAQPNACHACGPQLELWGAEGNLIAARHAALLAAAESICAGQIVAVMGLGGFHLIANARNPEAVLRLRERKHREEKPFATMYPALELIQADCSISPFEERLLLSAESPIVLLRRKSRSSNGSSAIAAAVAPGNPYLGVMLPYTPLHHLLMKELGFPVVATSGNLSDEPICIDRCDALRRLRGIADLFLVHNRPIVRHVDDSIVRVVLDRELVIRRARGYAPLPIYIRDPMPGILAVGGHLKNTIALSVENNVFISQHIGDLENSEAMEAFRKVVGSFQTLYETAPGHVAADLHPDYLSTRYAKALGLPVLDVQHHHAHIAACMAENELEGPVLGVSWDGTGFGIDGAIWGGEFLLVDGAEFQRVATLREFSLPGGERAIKEPRRTALGALFEVLGDALFDVRGRMPVSAFADPELAVLRRMLGKAVNSPRTSSAGRLFDAVASITGLRQRINFEGQAAMELEFAIDEDGADDSYPFSLRERPLPDPSADADPAIAGAAKLVIVDWEPLLRAILHDTDTGIPPGKISRRFHNTLVESILAVAKKIGEQRVVLTGGCFQNRYLTERTVLRLQAEGFRPYWHQRVPPNDGGIALGQAVVASRWLKKKSHHQCARTPGS